MGGKAKGKRPKRLTWVKWHDGPPGYMARFGWRMMLAEEISKAEIIGWYRVGRLREKGKL